MMRLFATLFVLLPAFSLAQDAGPLNIIFGDDLLNPNRIFQLFIMLTVLSLAPGILMMVTSFTRIVVVFSFLRSALGLQNSPPNTVLISLAMFLTAFIMAPVFKEAYNEGIAPYLNQEIDESAAFSRTTEPFADFMLANVDEDDLGLFVDMLSEEDRNQITISTTPEGVEEVKNVPLQALIPAFIISELRRAFEIGFLLFLPFLVIDLTIASILMSMGMMMLPPVIVSMPFKIIFFVMVDGWHLLSGSLVESFRLPL